MPLHSSPSWGFNVSVCLLLSPRSSCTWIPAMAHLGSNTVTSQNSLLCNSETFLSFCLPCFLPSTCCGDCCHSSSLSAGNCLACLSAYKLQNLITWFTAVPTACWEVFCAWEQANTQDSQEDKRTADGLEQCPELNVWCRVGTASLLFYWFLKLAQS